MSGSGKRGQEYAKGRQVRKDDADEFRMRQKRSIVSKKKAREEG